MAFISYTERPISALGSAWEAGTRLIWSKPFIMGPEYSPIRWTAFWNWAHQKHAHPNRGAIKWHEIGWNVDHQTIPITLPTWKFKSVLWKMRCRVEGREDLFWVSERGVRSLTLRQASFSPYAIDSQFDFQTCSCVKPNKNGRKTSLCSNSLLPFLVSSWNPQ